MTPSEPRATAASGCKKPRGPHILRLRHDLGLRAPRSRGSGDERRDDGDLRGTRGPHDGEARCAGSDGGHDQHQRGAWRRCPRAENASRMIAIQTPAKIAAQRSRAAARSVRSGRPSPDGVPKWPDSRSRLQEVPVRLRSRAVGVGGGSRRSWISTSAARHRRQDDVGGELAELGREWEREAVRDLAHVGHPPTCRRPGRPPRPSGSPAISDE